MWLHAGFLPGSWRMNSGPHDVCILLTKPLPQPCYLEFLWVRLNSHCSRPTLFTLWAGSPHIHHTALMCLFLYCVDILNICWMNGWPLIPPTLLLSPLPFLWICGRPATCHRSRVLPFLFPASILLWVSSFSHGCLLFLKLDLCPVFSAHPIAGLLMSYLF